jgi:hypothetical protein
MVVVVGRTTTIVIPEREITYNGGDSELLLLGVLEETEDIVTDDDAGLAAENFSDTHIE